MILSKKYKIYLNILKDIKITLNNNLLRLKDINLVFFNHLEKFML